MARARNSSAPWDKLNWSDLEEWAGASSLERGRRYFQSGHVSNLTISAEGALLATVQGTERYATSVSLTDDDQLLDGWCTCPIGCCCKHSVAVVLAYLDALEKKLPVPTASPDDPRWDKLEAGGRDECEDDWPDDEDDSDDDYEEPPPRAVSRGPVPKAKPRRTTAADRKSRVRAMLATWSTDRLVDFIVKLAATDEGVRHELEEQAALQTDDVRELIAGTRKEIRQRTAEEAWSSHWDSGASIPDYSGVERRFERLFEAKQYDALLDLGQELFDRGQEQVGLSNDEGETADGIAQCLKIVAAAVPKSSRPPVEQLFYVIGLIESDDYSLSEPFGDILDCKWPKAVWSEVADRLLERPRATTDSRGDWGRNYERSRQNRWIVTALEGAGRHAEILPLLEAEVEQTQEYADLARRLLAAGRTDDARRWIAEGIAATRVQWPGIADSLHSILRDLAVQAKDWPTVAAYAARPYFEHPSKHALDELLKAARKAGVEEAVRAAAMYFAETGKRPTGRNGSPPWPLPAIVEPPARPGTERTRPDPFQRFERPAGPSYHFLIDLAIADRRPEDVLRWYDAWAADKREPHQALYESERVADAVTGDFPDRALEVYRRGVEHHVNTGDSSYRDAGRFCRKIKQLLVDHGRAGEWEAYEAKLREQNKRKRNFLAVLDRVDRDRIIGGKK